ncbi:hypothetical protein JCM11251_004788 [Rhodosporidiobolus azoricus]
MSDVSIHFLTADLPPVAFAIPRSSLVANSRVFADLLSLPASASAGGLSTDEPIELYDPADLVRVFFALLSGESMEAVSGLNEVGWEELARMGDKYDSHVVKLAVVARIWTTGKTVANCTFWPVCGTSRPNFALNPTKIGRSGGFKPWPGPT